MEVENNLGNNSEAVFKHIVKEANRLLLDERYSGLDCATNEEIELANIIADILPKVASSSKDGLTLDEVTIGIFPELRDSEDIDSIPDEQYLPKRVKVRRAIDLLKKRALEAIVKLSSNAVNMTDEQRAANYLDIPCYICSAYSNESKGEVFFDAGPRNNDAKDSLTRLQQFYRSLGFEDLDKHGKYVLTQRGLGVIRDTSFDSDTKGIEQKIEQGEEESDVTDEEISDIISNLQGNYTSERGLEELMDLASSLMDLMRKAIQKRAYQKKN